jgi:hypothetical protein
MHLLPNNPILQALAQPEKFFLELWHSMTHERSLDSYRVRCLNSRTILKEIDSELRGGRIQPDELLELCEEATDILNLDSYAAQAFPRHFNHVLPLLQKPPIADEKKKDKDAAYEQSLREFKFTVADFSVALERDYFKHLLQTLPDTIASGDENKIHECVGALLSDLVDQGWPIESLFGWVDLFKQKKPAPHGTFNGNIHFLIRNLNWGRQPHRVILQLTGSSKLGALGNFEGFEFRSTPSFTATTAAQKKFSTATPLVVFAETEVQAVDSQAAAIAAREAFEQCLDRMRFNFEPSPLHVNNRCFVERKGDKRVELVTVCHLVPNPTHHLTAEAFREFSQGINTVLSRSSIEAETRERILAAIRHYRFGRDAESYKDKFLNWWMGLEFLTHVTDGYIGRTVARHTSDALLQRYFYRLLGDLLRTMQEQRVEWSPALSIHTGCYKLSDIRLAELLKVLQSPPHADELAKCFANHPAAAFRIRRLAFALQDPSRTAEMLNDHYLHLKWQVSRLYRIRCCIVHGSPVRFKFPLLTANLEFYLKELIVICLRSIGLNPHVTSLREMFERAQIARQRTETALKAAKSSADAVWGAVFDSVVIQENP